MSKLIILFVSARHITGKACYKVVNKLFSCSLAITLWMCQKGLKNLSSFKRTTSALSCLVYVRCDTNTFNAKKPIVKALSKLPKNFYPCSYDIWLACNLTMKGCWRILKNNLSDYGLLVALSKSRSGVKGLHRTWRDAVKEHPYT